MSQHSEVPIDRDHDLTRLGPLGCGVQTGAGAVMNTLRVPEGSSLVVAGAGALGLAAIMAAKVVGAGTVVAIDRHRARLELARQYGATAVLTGDPADLAAGIRDLTGGGADYAFDTTGNAAVVRALYEGINNLRTLGMAGVGFGDISFDFLSMIGGRTITGVMEGDSTPGQFIPHLARLNADGRFPFHELIEPFPLEEINEAEASSAAGTGIEPVLLFA